MTACGPATCCASEIYNIGVSVRIQPLSVIGPSLFELQLVKVICGAQDSCTNQY